MADVPMTARDALAYMRNKYGPVGKQTLWAWIREGKMPAIRTPGGSYRIRPSAIDSVFIEINQLEADIDQSTDHNS